MTYGLKGLKAVKWFKSRSFRTGFTCKKKFQFQIALNDDYFLNLTNYFQISEN